jgi:hypothetical protein
MRLFVLTVVAALTAAGALRSAAAEPHSKPSLPLYYLDIDAEGFAAAAFSEPYGRLLVAEFAAVLDESAALGCLKQKGVEKDQLAERARNILLQRGAGLLKKLAGTIDRAAFTAKLTESEGPDALAELSEIRDKPDVRTFDALSRPTFLAEAADLIVENVDRYALIRRIKLLSKVSPYGSGKQALLDADPTDKSVEALSEFMRTTRSAAIDRYLDLGQSIQTALNESISRDAMLELGPNELLSGLDKDLEELCVSGPP